MAGKPLAEKLRLSEGSSALVLNGPENYQELLGSIPDQVRFLDDCAEEVDFVHLFAANKKELLEQIDQAVQAVKYDGLLWISYPKGSSGVVTDINRDSLWELIKDRGIRPVTQVSVNDTWSALRFRPAERVGK
mgnify:CR=1 FL=1